METDYKTCIDLHVHSNASDGSDSPAEIVHKAEQRHLSVVALTDHDTISGLKEFAQQAKTQSVKTIPGIEISTQLFCKEIHIVGLFIGDDSPELNQMLLQLRDGRVKRNQTIIEKLNAGGYPVTEEEVLQFARGESIGRPHIAQVLIQKGYAKNMDDAFLHFLRRGAPFYESRFYLPVADSIRAIHSAGGLAIWAHPLSDNKDRSAFRKLIKFMKPLGLDGIETKYSSFNPVQEKIAQDAAQEFHLLASGGSDYHGASHAGCEIGVGFGDLSVPYSFFEQMLEYRNHLSNS